MFLKISEQLDDMSGRNTQTQTHTRTHTHIYIISINCIRNFKNVSLSKVGA